VTKDSHVIQVGRAGPSLSTMGYKWISFLHFFLLLLHIALPVEKGWCLFSKL